MAEYYVDGVNGDDTNSGTSKDQAWKTINKATQTMTAGDITYVRPGTYREQPSFANSGDATNGYIQLIGDINGEIWGEKGYVRVTALDNDTDTTPARGNCMRIDNKQYIKVKNFFFDSAIYEALSIWRDVGADTEAHVEVENCIFYTPHKPDSYYYDVTIHRMTHVTVKKCIFYTSTRGIDILHSDSNSDKNIIIENNIFIGGNYFNDDPSSGIRIEGSSAGVKIKHNTIYGFRYGIEIEGGNSSYQHQIKYNIIENCYYGIHSSNSSYQVSDYNFLKANYDHLYNVTTGANDKQDVTPLFIYKDLDFHPDSPAIDYIDDTGDDVSEDFFGNPRPLGTARDVGAVEYNPPEEKESTEVRTGSCSLQLNQASFKDIKTFLSAGSYTVSVYVKWSGYSGSDKPQLIVKKDEYCGIDSDQVVTASGDGSDWEQLSVNITLTKDAEITIRLYARDTGSSAVTYFDDLDIS